MAGAALCVSSVAFAAPVPLAPGSAAGIKQAQEWNRIPVWGYVGGVLVIIGFVAVLSNNSSGHSGGTCGTENPSAGCGPNSSGSGTN
jgi:hypothetical protein